jgi:hypothetical protein
MQLVLAMILLLILRTRMSIWLADVNGRVVKAIVNKNLPMFLKLRRSDRSSLLIRKHEDDKLIKRDHLRDILI